MATTFYFPVDTPAPCIPAYGGWGYTTKALGRYLATVKGSSAITIGERIGPWTATAGFTALDRQYVSDPIAQQTISGTVSMQLMVREYSTQDNVDRLSLLIKVVSGDGSILRGTLLALGNYGPTLEFISNTTHRNKTGANGQALSSVSALNGDRIVVEIGYTCSGSCATPEASAKWGENAGDLSVNETQTTDGAGWITFSANITWPEQRGGTAAVSGVGGTEGAAKKGGLGSVAIGPVAGEEVAGARGAVGSAAVSSAAESVIMACKGTGGAVTIGSIADNIVMATKGAIGALPISCIGTSDAAGTAGEAEHYEGAAVVSGIAQALALGLCGHRDIAEITAVYAILATGQSGRLADAIVTSIASMGAAGLRGAVGATLAEGIGQALAIGQTQRSGSVALTGIGVTTSKESLPDIKEGLGGAALIQLHGALAIMKPSAVFGETMATGFASF